MKKYFVLLALALAGCTTLSSYEKKQLKELEYKGITVEHPKTDKWEAPASVPAATLLNILPGIGDFYLCGEDSTHCIYGALNLLTWPLSILWAVPGGAISATAINKRDLLYFYQYSDKK